MGLSFNAITYFLETFQNSSEASGKGVFEAFRKIQTETSKALALTSVTPRNFIFPTFWILVRNQHYLYICVGFFFSKKNLHSYMMVDLLLWHISLCVPRGDIFHKWSSREISCLSSYLKCHNIDQLSWNTYYIFTKPLFYKKRKLEVDTEVSLEHMPEYISWIDHYSMETFIVRKSLSPYERQHV